MSMATTTSAGPADWESPPSPPSLRRARVPPPPASTSSSTPPLLDSPLLPTQDPRDDEFCATCNRHFINARAAADHYASPTHRRRADAAAAKDQSEDAKCGVDILPRTISFCAIEHAGLEASPSRQAKFQIDYQPGEGPVDVALVGISLLSDGSVFNL